MIARLRGELLEAGSGRVVVDVGGVGYELLVPESVLARLPSLGEFVDLRVRQVFREDGVSLYGFLDPLQRRLFDLLTDVKGCGPKTGLALIGEVGEEAIAAAIATGDAKTLTRATGVGPRLAERIILEMKDKVAEEGLRRGAPLSEAGRGSAMVAVDDDLLEALLGLGYRRSEAEAAAEAARAEVGGIEDRLKAALRILKR